MSTGEARVVAHAKINLILRILAREESGFHTIETVFARLAIGDSVTVRITDSGRSVESDVPIPGAAEDNLAYRAALAFAERTGWPRGFAIEIEKRIPVGGGLGGGSADAGAVLRALAALSPNQVREHDLLSLAASLGSDVPFLTTAAPLALAWSRGERMLALPPVDARDVLLVLPGFSVSTAAAYSWLAASRAGASADASSDASASANMDPSADGSTDASASASAGTGAGAGTSAGARLPSPQLLSLADLSSWSSLAELASNDFEPVVSVHHPEIATILRTLRAADAAISLMSGSGSTVVGIFDSLPGELSFPLAARAVHTRTLTTVTPVEVVR